MNVTVKFVGSLRRVADKSTMEIVGSTNFSVKNLIQKILLDIPEMKTDIINQQTDGSVKTNALILVNDREISVLNGLDTLLVDDDKIVFIPVTHGG